MDWQFIFAAINSTGLIVTLMILIIQTWLSRKQTAILQTQTKAALEASGSLSLCQIWDMMFTIDDMFLKKPHLRQYFYEGVPLDEKDSLYPEAESTAEKWLDIMEHLLWQTTLFPNLYVPNEQGAKSIWDCNQQYFLEVFLSSPLLLAFVEKRRSWYTPLVNKTVEKARYILDQRNSTSDSQYV